MTGQDDGYGALRYGDAPYGGAADEGVQGEDLPFVQRVAVQAAFVARIAVS